MKKNKNNKNPFIIQSGKLGSVRSSYRKAWAEECLPGEGDEKEVVGRSFDFSRLKFIIIFFLVFSFVLGGRIFYLQAVKGDFYRSMAEENRVRIKRQEPARGVIYDRDGKPLVLNSANFLLYAIPSDLPKNEEERKEMIKDLAESAEMEVSEIYAKLEKTDPKKLEYYQPVFLKDNIVYEKAMFLYMKTEDMPGVFLDSKTGRKYVFEGESLSHILGYTGKISPEELKMGGEEYYSIDYIGKTGVEYFWENELRGENGYKHVEVDALGKEKKIINMQPSEDGANLVLSIDSDLQFRSEEILKNHLEELGLKNASIVIMDPENGEILTLISWPSYDNNNFADGISQEEYSELINREDRPLFNRAVSGEYPSGSTFKPVISAIALEEGVISEHTSFNSVGGVRIGQWFYPDWRAGGHGITDVRKAISQSVNTFFYYIGGGYPAGYGAEAFTGLGVDRITEGAKLFGLGSQTGIDLAGEASGFLPSKEWKEEVKGERWYIGDTYHLAIGQGDILVTPLQVANFTAVFANGGSLPRPHLVSKVLTDENKIDMKVDDYPIRKDFLDPYNVEVVRQGMRKTITEGSGRLLSLSDYTSAGKTGTAQWSSKKDHHAWFTAFAPYENPEVVITVLVEEGGEGSDVAVPIAKEILDWYFDEERLGHSD